MIAKAFYVGVTATTHFAVTFGATAKSRSNDTNDMHKLKT